MKRLLYLGELTLTNHDTLVSPKLRLLRQELDGGNMDALEAFWQEVASQGTPLIEPIEGDQTQSLVTFLWRADRELNGVAVISLLTGLVDNKLTRMLDTDLWYGTWKAANDLRATYQFEPIDPEVQPVDEEDMLARFSRYRHDPLNPLTFVFERDEEDPSGFELIRSVLELPEAVSQAWIEPRDEVPKGKVELHRFRSEILNNERRVWVYTPPGYSTDENEPYGMVVLFDGLAYVDYVPTPTILDNMIDADLVPPMVAVFPDSLDMETRIRELVLHSPFNDFLVKELVPWVRANFHVSDNPKNVVVGGSSAGGLAAAFAALEHPEVFGNVLSQSGAFSFSRPGEEGHEWLTRQFAAREKLPLRFHLDAGSLETKSLRPMGDAPNLILANRNLRDTLKEKGYNVRHHEFSGGHDYISWRGTFSDGLQYLIGR
ncbi:MAG: alpha/beta hydrolase-fold protein [Candidatus Thorarchaeota archaeon]